VFAIAAMKQGHIIVDGCVHVIPNSGHHNMTWMSNQVTIMKTMYGANELNLVNRDTESLTLSKHNMATTIPFSEFPVNFYQFKKTIRQGY
jgi:hypothetical protein